MAKFDDFVDAVLKECAKLATGSATALKTEIKEHADAFLAQTAAKLELWTTQLAAGELSKLEFADLVRGQKTLAKMQALASTGMVLGELQRLRDGILNAVVTAAISTFL